VLDTVIFALIITLWVMCPFLIGMILLQGGAGDMSSAFGGGGALDSTLGVGAGRKMSKLTGWLAFAFLIMVAVVGIPHSTLGVRAARSSTAAGAGATVTPAVVGAPAEASAAAPIQPPTVPATPADAAAPALGEPVAPAPTVPAEPVLVVPEAPAAPAPGKSALTVE